MHRRQFRPTHPGEMLRLDFLPDYRLSAEDFASAIHLPLDHIESLLSGTCRVDADVALRLARFFGNSPEFWMAMQRDVDFFDAHEAVWATIDDIVPVDPSASVCLQEREPLPEELVTDLCEQLADIRDETRWVICSCFCDEDPIEDDSLAAAYYDVGSDTWAVGIEHGTAFKREWAALAVAGGLRDGVKVFAVTPERLTRATRIEARDHAALKRHLRRLRSGTRPWRAEELLQSEADMVAYLEIAAEEAEQGLLAAAVNDVLSAVRARLEPEESRG